LAKSKFSKTLLKWHSSNARAHPWKNTKNPYFIWLSEIILQQTRVEAGTPYYLKFIKTYPKIQDLANAELDEVYALWKGLGYYSRAKNLHSTAKKIVSEYNGIFPQKYEEILSLKGIGPYTAAAISSFAFDLPYPVIDGNVKRVLARHEGYSKDVLATKAKTDFTRILDILFDPTRPAAFNQAIMDFGATLCKPKAPLCPKCPLHKSCYALKHNVVRTLPVRLSKIKRIDRFFHFFVFKNDNQIIFRKRIDKDIWQNLFDFPIIESAKNEELSQAEASDFLSHLDERLKYSDLVVKGPKSQLLTHQRIIARFYTIKVKNLKYLITESDYHLVDLKNNSSFAVPKIIDWYLKDNSISLFS